MPAARRAEPRATAARRSDAARGPGAKAATAAANDSGGDEGAAAEEDAGGEAEAAAATLTDVDYARGAFFSPRPASTRGAAASAPLRPSQWSVGGRTQPQPTEAAPPPRRRRCHHSDSDEEEAEVDDDDGSGSGSGSDDELVGRCEPRYAEADEDEGDLMEVGEDDAAGMLSGDGDSGDEGSDDIGSDGSSDDSISSGRSGSDSVSDLSSSDSDGSSFYSASSGDEEGGDGLSVLLSGAADAPLMPAAGTGGGQGLAAGSDHFMTAEESPQPQPASLTSGPSPAVEEAAADSARAADSGPRRAWPGGAAAAATALCLGLPLAQPTSRMETACRAALLEEALRLVAPTPFSAEEATALDKSCSGDGGGDGGGGGGPEELRAQLTRLVRTLDALDDGLPPAECSGAPHSLQANESAQRPCVLFACEAATTSTPDDSLCARGRPTVQAWRCSRHAACRPLRRWRCALTRHRPSLEPARAIATALGWFPGPGAALNNSPSSVVHRAWAHSALCWTWTSRSRLRRKTARRR